MPSLRFGVDESIIRLKAAVAAGADVAFFEAARSAEDVFKVVEALKPTPVLLNLLQGGVTPDFTIPEMEKMGVKIGVRVIFPRLVHCNAKMPCAVVQIYPTTGLMVALQASLQAYKHLKETGTYVHSDMTIREFFAVVGLEDSIAIDKAAGGTTYSNGI